jgi:ATP-dependent DNA ligase
MDPPDACDTDTSRSTAGSRSADERKFDGERSLGFKNGNAIRMLSRNQLRIRVSRDFPTRSRHRRSTTS